MKHNLSRVLGATALSSLSTVAFADGHDPTVLTQGEVIGQISQLATVTGSTASGAYSFTPEWSEELGFSATGAVGFRLQDNSALGLIVTGGERKREVLLNFGLEFDAERQMVLTAGQLQERLEFGTDANQEWVKQNEFGLAYETTNYAFSVYQVDSETTDNFVGAKSTGAELSGSVDVSDAMTVGFGAGYEKLERDDGAAGVDGLTASLDVGYQANATTRLNVFADHNMSENQFGFGGSWTLGAATLDARYTVIDGRVGAVTDDNRLAVTFTMPLGGKSTSEVSHNATPAISASASPTSTLLADVMRRPDYLHERVIVTATSSSVGCAAPDFASASPVRVGQWENINSDGMGVTGTFIETTSAEDYGSYTFYWNNGGIYTPISGGENIIINANRLEYTNTTDWLYAFYLAEYDPDIFAVGGLNRACDVVYWEGD